MKKILAVSVLCIALVFTSVFAYAATTTSLKDWIVLKGQKFDGTLYPTKAEMKGANLQVSMDGGHYDDDGNYTGVILNVPVKVDGFTVEFTIDKFAGGASVDNWIGVHMLSKNTYFSVSKPAQSQGIVSLLRPQDDKVSFWAEVYQHVSSFKGMGGKMFKAGSKGAMKVQFKKNSDGSYSYLVSGQNQGAKLTDLKNVFKDGKGYFAIGMSTSLPKPMQVTITKINGKSVAAAIGDFKKAK